MKTGSGWLAIAVLGGLAACSRPLPEEGTAAAETYRERCGVCHRVYAPGSLKYPMWEIVVGRMEQYLVRTGRGQFAAEDRATILDYLRRNAAG